MKKTVLTLLTLLLISCDYHYLDNGDLDGFWHIERIDTLGTGGSADLSKESRFWKIQGRLMELSRPNTFLFYQQREDDSLHIRYHMYVYNGSKKMDTKRTALYGINSVEEHFKIVQLSSSTMLLRNEEIALHFKKY